MTGTGRALALAATLVCISALGRIGIMAPMPRVWSPFPTLTIVPVFWALAATNEAPKLHWISLWAVPMLVGPLLLLAWHPRLVIGTSEVPRRSWWGLGALTLLTGVAFWGGWDYGLKYQSRSYVVGLLVLNVLLLLSAWGTLAWARRHPSPTRTLIAHGWVVGWLVWVALPWLGELP
jgi:hypothetical protein